MRPVNRHDRGRTLGELVRAKLVLLAVRRRCKHQSLLYALSLIERFGENTPAIDIRPHLRCTACRYRSTNLHESDARTCAEEPTLSDGVKPQTSVCNR